MQATAGDRRKKALKALGLPEGADLSRVRSAFRKLAFSCHPDLHGGDPDKARQFQELIEAYQFVTDETSFAPPPGHPKTSPSEPVRGRDLHYRLRLDFLQAALGGEVSLRYSRRVDCPECGDERRSPCPRCRGVGRLQQESLIGVRVPSGVEDGEILRFRGKGSEGLSSGEAGDLHLLLSVRGHPALQRRGLDIYSDVKLTEARLLEGGPVEISTIHGTRRITLPLYTPAGKIFQLKGLGIKRRTGDFTDYGDHFVRVVLLSSETAGSVHRTPAGSLAAAAAKSG